MKALLIIDVQEEFIGHRRDEAQYQAVFAAINDAAARFRQAHCPVVVIRDISDGDDSRFDTVRELVTAPSDIQITKKHPNSFWQTELENILRDRGVDWLLLCGSAAEFCVTASYFGAAERGFTAFILHGGVLSATAEGLALMEKLRPSVSPARLSTLFTEQKE